jgi:hypothetical protein
MIALLLMLFEAGSGTVVLIDAGGAILYGDCIVVELFSLKLLLTVSKQVIIFLLTWRYGCKETYAVLVA